MSDPADLPDLDRLIFLEESGSAEPVLPDGWKLLVVDDDDDVHRLTRMSLDQVVYKGRGLQFLHAYTAAQARAMLEQHPDVAVILLDVVMETDHAGLELVHQIRTGFGNRRVRIVLRTGQPGTAPERRVIVAYDINDYREKAQMTSLALFTAIMGALRNYDDIVSAATAEQEIARQREALQRSEKLAAMGSLLAGVAHELNNPLAIVAGQAQLLRETAPSAAVAARADKIAAATNRCIRIVRTFLDMARQHSPTLAAVSLNTLITGAIDLLRAGLDGAGIVVGFDFDPALPDLQADADQLSQVLMNLVINAQQAMAAEPGPRRLLLTTRHQPEAGTVRFAVIDSGPGVPVEIRSRLFEPFFTTKAVGAGTGLGLAICQGMVGAHGGTITLEDPPGGGAAFVVTLPLTPAKIG